MHQRSAQSLEVESLVAVQKAQPMTAAAVAVMELPSPAALLAATMALGASTAVTASAGKAALWSAAFVVASPDFSAALTYIGCLLGAQYPVLAALAACHKAVVVCL